MKLSETERGITSLLSSVVLVATLTGTAFVGGVTLARRWSMPPLALPAKLATPQSLSDPAPLITPDQHVEGSLDGNQPDEWRFQGEADQAVTVNMWFHPGRGSNTGAEVTVRLISPSGEMLMDSSGSVFAPPYLSQDPLPATGSYHIHVLPLSGSLGRYSLNVSLSDRATEPDPGGASTTRPTPDLNESAVIAQPQFQWPTHRRTISGWTFRDPRNPGHIGLDIAADTWDPIVACADGSVAFAEWGGGYGNLVILEHGDGWSSYYAHLTEIAVHGGQDVRQGETLGGAGTTGYSTGPHLHFELRYRGQPVDPHVHLP